MRKKRELRPKKNPSVDINTYHSTQGQDDVYINKYDVGRDNQNNANQFLLQLSIRSHQHVTEFIKLADQKAAVIITLLGASLAFAYKSSWFKCFNQPLTFWEIGDYFYFIAAYLLCVSIVFAFSVLKPRLKPSKPKGFIFWESVASFSTSNDYCNKVERLNDGEVIREIFDHHYQLSKVCNRKYLMLNVSILFGAIGIAISALIIIFTNP